MNRRKSILIWLLRGLAALIMLQTLYFKFSAAPESVYIFSQLGIEPWGRLATGAMELIASVLILIPFTTVLGALLAVGIMVGAIFSHLFVLGISVMDDGGQLFIYASIVLLCSVLLIWIKRKELTRFLPGAFHRFIPKA
jgi:uncharacterized membrane protein YphA (DoxX/SURF4 family)